MTVAVAVAVASQASRASHARLVASPAGIHCERAAGHGGDADTDGAAGRQVLLETRGVFPKASSMTVANIMVPGSSAFLCHLSPRPWPWPVSPRPRRKVICELVLRMQWCGSHQHIGSDPASSAAYGMDDVCSRASCMSRWVRPNVAAQSIWEPHTVACLPADLGCALRLLAAASSPSARCCPASGGSVRVEGGREGGKEGEREGESEVPSGKYFRYRCT